jgi:putative transposase
MPRTARLIMDNAVYHVMARGNQKQATFVEEADFLTYIDLLKHYKTKYQFKLYAYCLMPNHVHLILKVKKGSNLGKIMQGVNLTYAILFNGKYKKIGHLWQGRYKSKVIEKNKYLLECLEYVEFNPIRASISDSPFKYTWTSWQERMGYKKEGLLDIPEIS